jgi:hypothetical protein
MRGEAGFFLSSILPGSWPYNQVQVPVFARQREPTMPQIDSVNPTSEHGLYLHLFITNAGGW